jgi:hypothetical protein
VTFHLHSPALRFTPAAVTLATHRPARVPFNAACTAFRRQTAKRRFWDLMDSHSDPSPSAAGVAAVASGGGRIAAEGEGEGAGRQYFGDQATRTTDQRKTAAGIVRTNACVTSDSN